MIYKKVPLISRFIFSSESKHTCRLVNPDKKQKSKHFINFLQEYINNLDYSPIIKSLIQGLSEQDSTTIIKLDLNDILDIQKKLTEAKSLPRVLKYFNQFYLNTFPLATIHLTFKELMVLSDHNTSKQFNILLNANISTTKTNFNYDKLLSELETVLKYSKTSLFKDLIDKVQSAISTISKDKPIPFRLLIELYEGLQTNSIHQEAPYLNYFINTAKVPFRITFQQLISILNSPVSKSISFKNNITNLVVYIPIEKKIVVHLEAINTNTSTLLIRDIKKFLLTRITSPLEPVPLFVFKTFYNYDKHSSKLAQRSTQKIKSALNLIKKESSPKKHKTIVFDEAFINGISTIQLKLNRLITLVRELDQKTERLAPPNLLLFLLDLKLCDFTSPKKQYQVQSLISDITNELSTLTNIFPNIQFKDDEFDKVSQFFSNNNSDFQIINSNFISYMQYDPTLIKSFFKIYSFKSIQSPISNKQKLHENNFTPILTFSNNERPMSPIRLDKTSNPTIELRRSPSPLGPTTFSSSSNRPQTPTNKRPRSNSSLDSGITISHSKEFRAKIRSSFEYPKLFEKNYQALCSQNNVQNLHVYNTNKIISDFFDENEDIKRSLHNIFKYSFYIRSMLLAQQQFSDQIQLSVQYFKYIADNHTTFKDIFSLMDQDLKGLSQYKELHKAVIQNPSSSDHLENFHRYIFQNRVHSLLYISSILHNNYSQIRNTNKALRNSQLIFEKLYYFLGFHSVYYKRDFLKFDYKLLNDITKNYQSFDQLLEGIKKTNTDRYSFIDKHFIRKLFENLNKPVFNFKRNDKYTNLEYFHLPVFESSFSEFENDVVSNSKLGILYDIFNASIQDNNIALNLREKYDYFKYFYANLYEVFNCSTSIHRYQALFPAFFYNNQMPLSYNPFRYLTFRIPYSYFQSIDQKEDVDIKSEEPINFLKKFKYSIFDSHPFTENEKYNLNKLLFNFHDFFPDQSTNQYHSLLRLKDDYLPALSPLIVYFFLRSSASIASSMARTTYSNQYFNYSNLDTCLFDNQTDTDDSTVCLDSSYQILSTLIFTISDLSSSSMFLNFIFIIILLNSIFSINKTRNIKRTIPALLSANQIIKSSKFKSNIGAINKTLTSLPSNKSLKYPIINPTEIELILQKISKNTYNEDYYNQLDTLLKTLPNINSIIANHYQFLQPLMPFLIHQNYSQLADMIVKFKSSPSFSKDAKVYVNLIEQLNNAQFLKLRFELSKIRMPHDLNKLQGIIPWYNIVKFQSPIKNRALRSPLTSNINISQIRFQNTDTNKNSPFNMIRAFSNLAITDQSPCYREPLDNLFLYFNGSTIILNAAHFRGLLERFENDNKLNRRFSYILSDMFGFGSIGNIMVSDRWNTLKSIYRHSIHFPLERNHKQVFRTQTTDVIMTFFSPKQSSDSLLISSKDFTEKIQELISAINIESFFKAKVSYADFAKNNFLDLNKITDILINNILNPSSLLFYYFKNKLNLSCFNSKNPIRDDQVITFLKKYLNDYVTKGTKDSDSSIDFIDSFKIDYMCIYLSQSDQFTSRNIKKPHFKSKKLAEFHQLIKTNPTQKKKALDHIYKNIFGLLFASFGSSALSVGPFFIYIIKSFFDSNSQSSNVYSKLYHDCINQAIKAETTDIFDINFSNYEEKIKENFLEYLKLYTPVSLLPARKTKETLTLCGYDLPKGTNVIYGIENTNKTDDAFGFGKHRCPGRNFVLSELATIGALLFKYFEFEYTPAHITETLFSELNSSDDPTLSTYVYNTLIENNIINKEGYIISKLILNDVSNIFCPKVFPFANQITSILEKQEMIKLIPKINPDSFILQDKISAQLSMTIFNALEFNQIIHKNGTAKQSTVSEETLGSIFKHNAFITPELITIIHNTLDSLLKTKEKNQSL
ncbi:hypothetical protein DID75_01195 [Candidatus Marinamargulisbacteria bacterium SCGC AG-410-N11]|nr:hypothetical protein DID75_01195 [Candidatus Marinamargulisbacteria bacterium SCGC AG-410-N11]